MKLLTFLGVAKYELTRYAWQDQVCETRYSPAASCKFLQADQLIVFLTAEAQEQVYAGFRAELGPAVEVTPMAVPLGQNEGELWEIFAQVGSCVQVGEEVAFDITNGLRSFPLVGLLVAAYLRSARQVNLKAVLYGAFDVGKQISPGQTPMFDLSPMISLLEWSAAADRFNRTGDARYLASLVRQQQKGLADQAQGDKTQLAQAGALGSLSANLTDISQALHLIRPVDTMERTAELAARIDAAQPALSRAAAAAPFEMLLDSVKGGFAPLGLAEPLQAENLIRSLEKQRLIIHRYAEWELWVQAITVAREWLVNWFMISLGQEDILEKSSRKDCEERINTEAYQQRSQKTNIQTGLGALPGGLDALKLWSDMVDARNDIDHAGMREQPIKAKNLVAQMQKLIERLDQLPIPEAAR